MVSLGCMGADKGDTEGDLVDPPASGDSAGWKEGERGMVPPGLTTGPALLADISLEGEGRTTCGWLTVVKAEPPPPAVVVLLNPSLLATDDVICRVRLLSPPPVAYVDMFPVSSSLRQKVGVTKNPFYVDSN